MSLIYGKMFGLSVLSVLTTPRQVLQNFCARILDPAVTLISLGVEGINGVELVPPCPPPSSLFPMTRGTGLEPPPRRCGRGPR